jgi:hypothetical protein
MNPTNHGDYAKVMSEGRGILGIVSSYYSYACVNLLGNTEEMKAKNH